MPRISVVVPTYNAEKYICEAVDSILTQTFTDFELIIIDDCSSDRTIELLESYCDERIKIIKGPCRGISAALNAGLDSASGEFIARMDADDLSLPERFQEQIAFMDTHPDVGLCGTLAEAFFPDGHTELWGNLNNQIEYLGIFDNLVDTVVCHPTVMFRRKPFQEYSLRYNEEFESAEDQELWTRAMRFTRFYNIQKVLLHYRVHGNNASTYRMESGKRNLLKVKIGLLEWMYPSGYYSEENLQEKILMVADTFKVESFMNRKESGYSCDLTFNGFPKWKKVIGLFLFNPSLFRKKLKIRLRGGRE